MTGPDSSTTVSSSPAPAKVIDGKYEVLRELSKDGNLTLYEVKTPAGEVRRVGWFDVSTAAHRQQFHAYRTALRAVAPVGLSDVVARPGAYYAVWREVTGTPLKDYLGAVKKREAVEAVETLATNLATHNYALADADILMDGAVPQVAYLRPQTRTPEVITALNTPTIAALNGGRVRRAKRPPQPGQWLAFIPGILFLAGAGWLGAQATQIYLNPPVGEVKNMVGKPAKEAAQALTSDGFRVEYVYGDSGGAGVGTIIRQDPAAGTSLPTGRLVTLTVNKPAPLTVPKLEDLTLEQAKAPLKDNVLKMGKILKVDGTLSNTPAGRIIAQVPAPGATTQRGEPVQVLVSTGVRGKETFIGELRGMTYDQARENARAAGLVVTEVRKEPSDSPENTVLRQSPAPFVRVDVGSKVILVIASAKYTPPSTPAGSLPIPPPYVPPPPPVEPDPGTTTTPGVTDPGTTTPVAPDQGTQQPVQQPNQEIPSTGTTDPGQVQTPEPLTAHTVRFSYVFPSDLPAGNYTVVVQDADGEREFMKATDANQLAGLEANGSETVRGNAVFVIRVNGAEFTRVAPQ